jgi:hypothetical protein
MSDVPEMLAACLPRCLPRQGTSGRATRLDYREQAETSPRQIMRTSVRDVAGLDLDRGNVTEALSSASELEHVGLAEALELCLLLRDKVPERYPRAALCWHGRLCREVDGSLEEAQAILAALVVIAGERKECGLRFADLLRRRGLERPCETKGSALRRAGRRPHLGRRRKRCASGWPGQRPLPRSGRK